MKNIINYIKKYGDISLKEKPLNNLDSAILTIIPYIDFKEDIIEKIDLNTFLSRFILLTDKNKFIKSGLYKNDIYNLIEELLDKKRYKDILVSDYIYKIDDNEQFGAITYHLNKNTKFIAFEGTNELLVGWEEDFTYSYLDLTASDKDAIKYLNRVINIFDKNIYIGGHSKGGRLSVISGMYISRFKKNKIKRIYSFDGPGLSKEQLYSKNYSLIENKIIHIVPNYSIVGLLLRHKDNYKVVKSTKIDINAHNIFSWYIDEDDFIYTNLSNISKKLDKSIILWLEEHTPEERRIIIKSIFNTFRDLNLTTLDDIGKIKNLFNLLLINKNYDKDTIKVIENFLTFNIAFIIKEREDDE